MRRKMRFSFKTFRTKCLKLFVNGVYFDKLMNSYLKFCVIDRLIH